MQSEFHKKNIIYSGKALDSSNKVLIMLHGRGSTSEDILSLKDFFNLGDFSLLAPQAENYTWYPNSFLVPPQQNEPWLSSALNLISEIVQELKSKGFSSEQIYLLGFSQGACLTLEFAARNADKYGGIAAFTGGLIGDKIYSENYKGNFNRTPIFIGTSNPDPHVPLERVNQSVEILKMLNAEVLLNVYPQMGHTISQDEINSANRFLFSK